MDARRQHLRRISGDDNNNVHFNGLIDEPEVFNRALSAAEVQAIFNAGSAGKCKPTGCLLTCPANVVATNTAGQCGAIVNYAAPTASGNCGAVTCTPTNGSFFSVGATTVSCTTTNGGSCSFTVTVLDKENPAITLSGKYRAVDRCEPMHGVECDLHGDGD